MAIDLKKVMRNINNILKKLRIYRKKRIIGFSITLSRWVYAAPIITLYFIILAIIVAALMDIFTVNIPGIISNPSNNSTINNSTIFSLNPEEISKDIINKLLIYFFIMLGVVDLSILVLDRYVYKHIYTSIKNFEELAPESFTDERRDFIEDKANSPEHSKLYPEKLLVFGVIFILLEIFSKLFSDDGQDLKVLLVGISMVLISIGIWKYLSFKADNKNIDFYDFLKK